MSGTSLHSGMVALTALCALAASAPAAGESYITFSVQSGYDTYAYAINASGVVTGAVVGTDSGYGFVRAADGTITTFYAPNAAYTDPAAINRKGAIAGSYTDDAFVAHGFLRKPGGKIIGFDPTGSTYTQVFAINDSGVIIGVWYDANFNAHGFIRATDGTFITFDPSGSISTWPTAINANGDIAGYYWYTQYNAHGFLRTADGTITSFDAKNVSFTEAYGINRKDAIVGSGDGTTGFARTPGGRVKTFEPGESWSQASGINDKGQITGFYTLSQSPYGYGYVGSPKSGFTIFNVPNGTQTQPFGINNSGVITGSYYDANGLLEGFLRTP